MTRLLALSGSLRAASTNTALLTTLAELAPTGVEVVQHGIGDLPLYNSDLTGPALAPVERLKAAITAADGVLIAVPEYNYGIPGPLKNAIDWASRPAYASPFAGKPVAILGASAGGSGAVRAQGQLKQVLLGMGSQVFAWPEVAVTFAGQKITDGVVTDETTRGFLERFVVAFAAWAPAVPNPLG
ncbi:MAG: NAD(P)H-dependent oxidoreductase [Deltaproteobacteria bacterium]|nr:MAG: NAD(P)H-dependent oxidoreductase [Deltaproteobacteria bacterium]